MMISIKFRAQQYLKKMNKGIISRNKTAITLVSYNVRGSSTSVEGLKKPNILKLGSVLWKMIN